MISLKNTQFQAGYVIQMLRPMRTATKDWREAGEERRRGGKEERRKGREEERRRGGEEERGRGGEKAESRGDLLLFTRVLRAITNVLLLFTRAFKWYPLKPMYFQGRYVIQMLKPCTEHQQKRKLIQRSAKSS